MTETVKPLGARVYEIYLKNLERTPGLDPKEALADAYRKVNPQKDIQDFMSDVDDSLWYKKNIRKKIHDLIFSTGLLEESNLEHIIFTEVSLETNDFITEDALSLKPWMERWKSAHFFAPDLPLSESATAGKKTSTNIAWIGYDKKQLRVGFKNGWVYEYDVEPKFYTYMAGAPSKGQFLWNYLRGRSPGRVIDKPWKITPGGVGGSIVPYNKIAGRRLPERKIKRLQKKFGGEIKRGTQLKEVSKIRARKAEIRGGTSKVPSGGQVALIQKLEKQYKRDLIQDTIPVKGHYRNIGGHQIYIPEFERKGEKKKEVIGTAKEKGKTPLPEAKKLKTSKSEAVIKKWLAERRGEKPSEPPKKPPKKGLTPKDKIRKEIEHQAKGIRKQPAPDKREEAVQKLIEQTGYDRKRAEAEISKQFGPSKEEAATKEKQKKVQERTQQQVKQKQQQLQHSVLKLQILNQRNFKSEALKDILQLFADLLTGKGKNIIQASRRFKRNYTRLQRDQRISLQKKSALLGVINRLNTEIQGLSAPQKDFEVEDYPVKGYYSMRGKPPKRIFTRRHTREEGKSIQDKPRLTSEIVQYRHKISTDIPLWRKMKRWRKKSIVLTEKIEEAEKKGDLRMRNLYIQQLAYYRMLRHIPTRYAILSTIGYYKNNIERAKTRKEEDKRELDLELELEKKYGYKPNYTEEEWGEFMVQYEAWDKMIADYEQNIREKTQELEKAREYESQLYEDKSALKYKFDKPLHDKMRIAKGLNYYPYTAQINIANNTFYELPASLRDSCKELRIFQKANDDPTYGSLEGCGGFYDPENKTITVGCQTKRRDLLGYSSRFVKEATIHEAAHALQFQRLSSSEMADLKTFYTQNKHRLENRKAYARKNKIEFFAEGYAKLAMGNHAWFRGFTKGTKGFFQNISKKYDFIIDIDFIMDFNKKINGIKFSYQNEEGVYIFGVYRIPEDISQEEAEKLVSEGKAQFENIDKYFKNNKKEGEK